MFNFMSVLMQFSVIAYALVAGVFLAFSDFIMRSLAKTSGDGGVEAMQVINREVFRWVFMTLFLGMAPISLVIGAYAWVNLSGVPSLLIKGATIVYLVGCFGVTIAFNVPKNEALARMQLSEAETRDYWLQTYVPRWTFWNTVRTFASTAAAALLLAGLVWSTQS